MRLASAFLAASVAFAAGHHVGDLSLGLPSAHASTFVELTVDELVTGSASVVCGTPQERMSLWEDSEGGGRRIVSYTRVRVDRVIDGALAHEVWVRTLGGVVDDLGQRVEGEAVLVAGQPALMFLAARQDGTHSIVGMGQGQYPLDVPAGQPMKVLEPRAMGRMVPKLGNAPLRLPARLDLPGRTVDEVTALVASLRQAHAPR
jgi:hypothetical protein